MAEATLSDLLSPATLARIDNYALLARTVVEGMISGLHRSLYHGFGVEFFQYRSYVPGDDLKYVDWKVLGRRDRLYTKVFQEETNMNCAILLDVSGSMAYEGDRAPCSKVRYGCMAAACIAYLASRQGDAVGLYAYGDGLKTAVHPGQLSGGLQRVLTELQRLEPGGVADHPAAFGFAAEHLRRRGVVVLISDFHGVEDDLADYLRRFRFAHHDCVVIQVLDADELDLPFRRSTRFVDSEGAGEIVTAPERVRETYRRSMDAFLERVRVACLEQQADHLLLSSSDNLGNMLAAYLHRRESLT